MPDFPPWLNDVFLYRHPGWRIVSVVCLTTGIVLWAYLVLRAISLSVLRRREARRNSWQCEIGALLQFKLALYKQTAGDTSGGAVEQQIDAIDRRIERLERKLYGR